jgi:hypothetical protein
MHSPPFYRPFLVIAIIFLALSYLPLFADETTLDAFVREDGIFEDLTVIYLFGTFSLFGIALFYFRPSSWLKKLSYAGLTVLFLFGAGEELSWGERIFDWDDHNFIKGINVQKELTIHNLKYFQGEESILPVSVSQLFTAFVFLFAAAIPFACTFFSKIEQLVAPRFPVMPLPFGILAIVNYIFQKSMLTFLPMLPELYHHSSMLIPQGVHEIREHGYTFVLLLSSSFYVLGEWSRRKVDVSQAALDMTRTRGKLTSGEKVR